MQKPRVPFVNKDTLALLLTLFLSALLLFTSTSDQVQHLKFQISNLTSTIVYPIKWYNSIFSIREENKLLKNKLIQLNLMNSELQNYYYENLRLKEMLQFAKGQSVNYVSANVVQYNFGIPTQSIIVDIGTEEGVLKNLTVLDENGLLGKTIKTGKQSNS